MGTYLSKNLIKTSVTLGRNGEIISKSTAATPAEEMKQKQEERARKLGFRGARPGMRR